MHILMFSVEGLEEWRGGEGEKGWNKSSFWNQKLISKKSDFKQFIF